MTIVKQMVHLKTKVVLLLILVALALQSTAFAQDSTGLDKIDTYVDFKAEFMWEAKVTIGEAIQIGESKYGSRQVIPITGGTFKGPKIKGDVLPAGEDWQLVRPDGDVEFNARYMLKTDDGVVIQVINQALFHLSKSKGKEIPYLKSVLNFEAPVNSPYEYLNHAIFLGTIQVPKLEPGEIPYVVISVYKLL
ncbi:DUF3237 domain-containing protein [Plebeiibacterium marinum]|uniref:UPF0311 protein OM074_15095 n=1 Tax=Plebeiibacterium marinum TaxID=2992111 RepID=A0AAE3MG45_9BACT|nr:DUF3237 domain-containing protein [Plebeiobacterium marinum]MCW3806961.1 DUF3237 domain-containing protein [Plebeiobacterium marinum]